MDGNDVEDFWLALRKNSYCPKVVTNILGSGEVAIRASDLGSPSVTCIPGRYRGKSWLGSLIYKVIFNVVL